MRIKEFRIDFLKYMNIKEIHSRDRNSKDSEKRFFFCQDKNRFKTSTFF